MHLLGNLVCSIDFYNWQTVFHAITLPVLLYGLPVWSYKVPKSIVQILQVAQNDTIRRMSGTFRMTPVDPLHNMLAIPPIKYTIAKYRAAFTARISHLPPTAILRTLPTHDPSAIYIPPSLIPTPLTLLLPPSFPIFCIPSGLLWTHTNIHNGLLSPKTDIHMATILQIANNPPINHTSILVYPVPHPDHFIVAFLTFQDGIMIERGFQSSLDRVTAAADVAIAGILSLSRHPGQHTIIFVPNRTLHKPLFSLSKHKHLPQATLFTAALQMQCFLHPSTTIVVYPLPVKLKKKPTCLDPHIFACDWPGPRTKDYHLAELCAEAQLLHLPEHIPTPSLKSLPFHLWKDDQDRRPDPPRCKWTNNVIPVPESSLPLDLVIGSLSLGQQYAMSACLQVFTKHCFCREYSWRMCPMSGDVTTCPCTYSQTPLQMSDLDQNGNPHPRVKGDQDQFRWRTGAMWPSTVLTQDVSTDTQFEALMSGTHYFKGSETRQGHGVEGD